MFQFQRGCSRHVSAKKACPKVRTHAHQSSTFHAIISQTFATLTPFWPSRCSNSPACLAPAAPRTEERGRTLVLPQGAAPAVLDVFEVVIWGFQNRGSHVEYGVFRGQERDRDFWKPPISVELISTALKQSESVVPEVGVGRVR